MRRVHGVRRGPGEAVVLQGTCFGQGGNGGTFMDRNNELEPFAEYAVDGVDRELVRNSDDVIATKKRKPSCAVRHEGF